MSEIFSVAAVQTSGAAIQNSNERSRSKELIPQYVRQQAEPLIGFVQDYYDYLNEKNNASNLIDNIVREQDIDQVSANYLDGIQGEIAKNIPNSGVLDRVALYKKIVQYYKIKGSEHSVSAFFRIFYDEIVDVSYPKEQLFKLSSGDWNPINYQESKILRANYIGGTDQPISVDHIGTRFNIYNILNEVIGSAILSSFTNIDQGFDVALNETDLELKFDAYDANTVTLDIDDNAVSWTETSADTLSRVTVNAVNDVVYNLDDNVFEFDGVDDHLFSSDVTNDFAITDEFTLVTRLARTDNVLGNTDQCVVSLSETTDPLRRGINLYIDRVNGGVGIYVPNAGIPQLKRLQSATIELFNFDFGVDGIYYLAAGAVNGYDVYVANPDDVAMGASDQLIYHNGTRWVIEVIESGLVYESEATTESDVTTAGLVWTQLIHPGEDDDISEKDLNLFDDRVIVSEDFALYRYNLYNVLIYRKEGGEWNYHTKIVTDNPALALDYDDAERRIYVGDHVANKVHVYELNAFDDVAYIDTISGTGPSFGITVSARNGNVVVGRSDYFNDESLDTSQTFQYSSTNYASATQIVEASHKSKVTSTGNVLSALHNTIYFKDGVSDYFMGIDTDEYANVSFEYDSDVDQIIVGNPYKDEVDIFQNTSDGFWTTPSNITTNVSITVTNFTDGDAEQIGWGPSEDNYLSSSSGIVLLHSYTLGDLDSSNAITLWQRVDTLNYGTDGFGRDVSYDNGNLLVSDDEKNVHYFLYNGSNFVYNSTITNQTPRFGAKKDLIGNEVVVLGQDDLQRAYNFKLDNFVSNEYVELLTQFTNSPVDYGYTYSDTTIPVLTIDSKYHTVALKGKRDQIDGFLDVSVNGSIYERIYTGDTYDMLTVFDDADLAFGCNTALENFFSGRLTNVYYYNRCLDVSELLSLTEYLNAVADNWYLLQFSDIQGTFSKADKIIEETGLYIFDSLVGHDLDAFWEVESTPAGGAITIDVTYGPTLSEIQRVVWGDGTSEAFQRQDNGNLLRHVFVGAAPGKYLDEKGFASNNYKLHDGERYQEYSYVISPSLSPRVWEQEFLNLVHPAGMKYIAAMLLLIPRTNTWVGPKSISFDKTLNKYIWTKPTEDFVGPYETTNPLTNLDWMQGLIQPYLYKEGAYDGYHMPIFQPGWIDDLQIMLIDMIGDMFPNGLNAEDLVRVAKICLKLFIHDNQSRDERAREDYLCFLKFKDHTDISDYLYTTIQDAIDPFDETKWSARFSNWPSIITYTLPIYTITLQIILQGVDFNTLTPAEQDAVIDNLVTNWAALFGVDPEQIEIVLSEGSLVVDATITIGGGEIDPEGDDTTASEDLATQLEGIETTLAEDADAVMNIASDGVYTETEYVTSTEEMVTTVESSLTEDPVENTYPFIGGFEFLNGGSSNETYLLSEIADGGDSTSTYDPIDIVDGGPS